MLYGGFWSLMDIMFPIMFFLVFGIFLFAFVKGISEWNKNNHSPRLNVPAIVVAKRQDTTYHHHSDSMAMSHHTTSYYVTFEVESGDRMEFLLSGQQYGELVEGDRGMLYFQGTRFLGFDREF